MITSPKFINLAEAVVYIALNAKPNAVRGPEICAAQSLPSRYLEADLQKLVRSGILRSVRGPHGGYVLAKERRNITLADIFAGSETDDQKTGKTSAVTDALKNAEHKYLEELATITVESLCLQAAQSPGSKPKADFTI